MYKFKIIGLAGSLLDPRQNEGFNLNVFFILLGKETEEVIESGCYGFDVSKSERISNFTLNDFYKNLLAKWLIHDLLDSIAVYGKKNGNIPPSGQVFKKMELPDCKQIENYKLKLEVSLDF
jgi:hypothetical protein